MSNNDFIDEYNYYNNLLNKNTDYIDIINKKNVLNLMKFNVHINKNNLNNITEIFNELNNLKIFKKYNEKIYDLCNDNKYLPIKFIRNDIINEYNIKQTKIILLIPFIVNHNDTTIKTFIITKNYSDSYDIELYDCKLRKNNDINKQADKIISVSFIKKNTLNKYHGSLSIYAKDLDKYYGCNKITNGSNAFILILGLAFIFKVDQIGLSDDASIECIIDKIIDIKHFSLLRMIQKKLSFYEGFGFIRKNNQKEKEIYDIIYEFQNKPIKYLINDIPNNINENINFGDFVNDYYNNKHKNNNNYSKYCSLINTILESLNEKIKQIDKDYVNYIKEVTNVDLDNLNQLFRL
jgi:hypothetical protein